MAFQDLYEVKLTSEYLGQTGLNIFHFEYVEGGSPSNEIADELRRAFAQSFLVGIDLGPLLGRFSDQLTYKTAEVTNLSDPSVLHVQQLASSNVGQQPENPLPPYVAAQIQTGRLAGNIRRGMKRFWGISEIYQDGGKWIQLFMDSLQQICDFLNSPIVMEAGAGTRSFQSVVVKRVKYQTSEGKTAYRLPQTAEEAVWYEAKTWAPKLELTTQNTRKFNR